MYGFDNHLHSKHISTDIHDHTLNNASMSRVDHAYTYTHQRSRTGGATVQQPSGIAE